MEYLYLLLNKILYYVLDERCLNMCLFGHIRLGLPSKFCMSQGGAVAPANTLFVGCRRGKRLWRNGGVDRAAVRGKHGCQGAVVQEVTAEIHPGMGSHWNWHEAGGTARCIASNGESAMVHALDLGGRKHTMVLRRQSRRRLKGSLSSASIVTACWSRCCAL